MLISIKKIQQQGMSVLTLMIYVTVGITIFGRPHIIFFADVLSESVK
jgi:hypothetical protein